MTGTIVDSSENFTSVGKIRKAHGIRGELFLISFSKSFDWLEEVKEAQLVKKLQNKDGNWEEVRYNFPIKKTKSHKIGRILKLEGVNDRNLAEELEGAVFQVPNTLFSKGSEESYYLSEIKGFELSNKNGESLGKVKDFSFNGAQDLLLIETEGAKDFDVPYVNELIIQLDFVNKKLVMNLPEDIAKVADMSDKKEEAPIEL